MEKWEEITPGQEAFGGLVQMEGTDEGVVLFTGGTTGLPKPVVTTHGGTLGAVGQLAKVSKGRPGPYRLAHPAASPNLLALPLFHSGGQHTLLFAFYVGRSLLLTERFDAAKVVELVGRYRIDNLFLMPTMLYDLWALPEPVDISSVQVVLVAGQALDPELRRRFEERFRIPIALNYGSTEMGHVAGWTRADLAEGLWKPGSAGRLYEGVQVVVRDSEGTTLGFGEVGEICVRSDLSKGYLGDDAATRELIRDGWVHSGDVGYIDSDNVLFLIGRRRDMIKTGGFQVWPAELENALRSHPKVADAAVIGVPDPRLGEIPKAFVVVSGANPEGLDVELTNYMRKPVGTFQGAEEDCIRGRPASDANRKDRPQQTPKTRSGEDSQMKRSEYELLDGQWDAKGMETDPEVLERNVLYEKHPNKPIAYVTFNAPDRLNALPIASLERVGDLVKEAEVDDDVKVIVFRGAGPCFGTGADASELGHYIGYGRGEDKASRRRPAQRQRMLPDRNLIFGAFTNPITDCLKATIAQVHGYCYGGHMQIALATDLVVASPDALFTHPAFRYLGAAPQDMYAWIENLGLKKMKEIMLTMRPLEAEEAERIGFVNKVVPRDELDQWTEDYATAISMMPLDGIMMGKGDDADDHGGPGKDRGRDNRMGGPRLGHQPGAGGGRVQLSAGTA